MRFINKDNYLRSFHVLKPMTMSRSSNKGMQTLFTGTDAFLQCSEIYVRRLEASFWSSRVVLLCLSSLISSSRSFVAMSERLCVRSGILTPVSKSKNQCPNGSWCEDANIYQQDIQAQTRLYWSKGPLHCTRASESYKSRGKPTKDV